MRFSPDRCLECGTPVRPTDIPNSYSDLKTDGQFAETNYWFCGRDCYARAIDDFVAPTYRFGTDPHQDPDLKEAAQRLDAEQDRLSNDPDVSQYEFDAFHLSAKEEIDRLTEHWKACKRAERIIAQSTLRERIFREYQMEQEKLREAEIKKQEKERLREEEARLKEQSKLEADRLKQETKAEAEKAEREAFEEKLRPKAIPDNLRSQHTHILAPSGYGKSTLIQQIILNDLDRPDAPGYVVIDPKGELVDRISRLAVFGPGGKFEGRLVIIDPTDEELPALNMFAMPNVEGRAKQRVLNQLIETLAYVFSSAEAPLTQRQSIPFSFVVKLVFFMGGDINTLMDVLEDTKDKRVFAEQIKAFCETDAGAKRFFENDFYETPFKPTRDQIRTRIYEIISRPELMGMLAAKENQVSIFDCLQSGKMVLVNTARPLGSEASTILGRYMIALTINAAFSRYAIPKEEWRPAYLVIDEFQDFIDEAKTPEMLRLAREYNLGIIVAHQNMYSSELNEALRNSISTNTSIKFCAGSEGIDRAYMARDMRCEQEFLTTYTEPKGGFGQFACYVRGMGLTHPFIYPVPYGNIQAKPQMSAASHSSMRDKNRKALQNRPTVEQAPRTVHPVAALAPVQSPSPPRKGKEEKLW